MICYGTNCECERCGKLWTITYRDVCEYNGVIKDLTKAHKVNKGLIAYNVLFGNTLTSIHQAITTNTIINGSSHVIEKYKHGEYLQLDHCPECSSPKVLTERFYYETDNQGNYVREATEDEFNSENLRVTQAKEIRKQKNNKKWIGVFIASMILLAVSPVIAIIVAIII